MHIPKRLHAVHRVHMHVSLVRLATRLDLLRTTPHSVLAALCHLGIKALLLVVAGRRRDRASGARGARLRRGRCVFGRTSCCAPGSPSNTPSRGNKAHEVFGVAGDVIGEPDTDFLGVGEVPVQLVGEGVVEAIAYTVRSILRIHYGRAPTIPLRRQSIEP